GQPSRVDPSHAREIDDEAVEPRPAIDATFEALEQCGRRPEEQEPLQLHDHEFVTVAVELPAFCLAARDSTVQFASAYGVAHRVYAAGADDEQRDGEEQPDANARQHPSNYDDGEDNDDDQVLADG